MLFFLFHCCLRRHCRVFAGEREISSFSIDVYWRKGDSNCYGVSMQWCRDTFHVEEDANGKQMPPAFARLFFLSRFAWFPIRWFLFYFFLSRLMNFDTKLLIECRYEMYFFLFQIDTVFGFAVKKKYCRVCEKCAQNIRNDERAENQIEFKGLLIWDLKKGHFWCSA